MNIDDRLKGIGLDEVFSNLKIENVTDINYIESSKFHNYDYIAYENSDLYMNKTGISINLTSDYIKNGKYDDFIEDFYIESSKADSYPYYKK